MILDLFMLYQFLKRLATPFEDWEAFKLGIIDKEGTVLRPRAKLKDSELKAWGYFDIVIANLKKLLAKVPGGNTRIGTFAAALLLMREAKEYTEQELVEEIRVVGLLYEDAPTNFTGGAVAGAGPAVGDVKLNRRVKVRRRKSIVGLVAR